MAAAARAGAEGALPVQLAEEVGQLVEKHRRELQDCLASWARGLQAPGPQYQPRAVSKTPSDAVSAQRSSQLSCHNGGASQALATFMKLSDLSSPVKDQRTAGSVRSQCSVTPAGDAQLHSANAGSDRSSTLADRASLLPERSSIMQLPPHPRAGGAKTRVSISSRGRRPSRSKRIDRLTAVNPSGHLALAQNTWLQKIVRSRYYDWASALLISLNAVFIGWQTQYLASRAPEAAAMQVPLEKDMPRIFLVLQATFAILFFVELCPRWVCSGFCRFFREKDKWWNIMDVIVVSFSLVDVGLHISLQRRDLLGNLSVLRVLRVIRIVRVVRVIRIMKFFRELRLMISSILKSTKSLVWAILVLAMVFFVFGITFTQAAAVFLDSPDKWSNSELADLRVYFGSLDRSILSLFASMSGGREWLAFYTALQQLPAPYPHAFLLYISFALFAVVNIVTGVFVESAMQSTSDDKLFRAEEELRAKKQYLKAMQDVFEEMDEDRTGLISLDEFEAKLNDQRVIAYFNAMKLDVSDARKLFWLVDYDQSGEIDIDEFVNGCYELQGESRTLDIKFMQCEVHFLQEAFVNFSDMLYSLCESVEDLQGRFNTDFPTFSPATVSF